MESPAQPWFKRAIAAWAFAANFTGFLFAVTAVPFFALLFAHGLRSPAGYSFACFPLASAGLLMTVLAFFVPALVAGQKVRFPLNLTLPSLYSGLVALSSLLMANFRPSIALLGESPRTDQFWSRADFLGTAWVIQVACMTLWAVSNGRKGEITT